MKITHRSKFRWRPILSGLFLMLAFHSFSHCSYSYASPAQMEKADTLFNKKQYQEALKEYEPLLTSSILTERYNALYRSAECEALLFRYGEALQRISQVEVPQEPIWAARFLILKSELYNEFLTQVGYQSRSDVIEGEADVTRRTPAEMRQEVKSSDRKSVV